MNKNTSNSKLHLSVKNVIDDENKFDVLRKRFRKEFIKLCMGIMVIAILTGITNHFILKAIGAI